MPKHYFNRLEKIDSLIRIKGIGTPQNLSNRLGISKRTVYEYLDILKSLGAGIQYCKERRSYEEDGCFDFRFRRSNKFTV
ncbi:HTH domain-containing protein [Chitinophaga sp. 30R24]|uniref:HTH domain-containing protein n=1 Tax=Chitinophaga sp. 30R24 TaxID=3248838 RepID=UPI003B910A7B